MFISKAEKDKIYDLIFDLQHQIHLHKSMIDDALKKITVGAEKIPQTTVRKRAAKKTVSTKNDQNLDDEIKKLKKKIYNQKYREKNREKINEYIRNFRRKQALILKSIKNQSSTENDNASKTANNQSV